MIEQSAERPVRVGLISLGCAKNLVDAEVMLGTLLRDGMELTNQAEEADVLIVNTCSFINAAQQESVDTILESAELRKRNHEGQALIVSGCLPQRYRAELPRLLPEVDAFIGIDQVAQVSEIVKQAMARRAARLVESRKPKDERSRVRPVAGRLEGNQRRPPSEHAELPADGDSTSRGRTGRVVEARPSTLDSRPSTPLLDVTPRPTYIPDYATPRFRLTPRHYAYVKIAEGCNHPCSFCIIPRMRGAHRSRPQADVVREAKALVAAGVKELNLISQDSTYYGLDLRPNSRPGISSPAKFAATVRSLPPEGATICTLLRELNALPGDFWIRLLYTHPAHWTDDLIRTIAECPKVARYADIPLQHIHDNMLERMRRETSREHIATLLEKIRGGIPGMVLRTTFIVGFPGETEECFEALLDFIRASRFERLGVFAYSREEGTRAGAMSGQIPARVRQRRQARAMAVQRDVAREIAKSFVGRRIKVLVERQACAGESPDNNLHSAEHGWLREKESQISDLESQVPNLKSQISNLESQIHCLARSEADAPDIDGRVYVRGCLAAGQFAQVKITGHTDYDLAAVPA